MNVARARELLDDLKDEWSFTRLAKLIEDLRHVRHPNAPHLCHPEYALLIRALATFTEALALPVVSYDSGVQAHYVAMRMDGSGHTLAEMLALQVPPMSNTDREFLEGYCNGSQFEKTPGVGDYYARVAKEHGADITGKVYMPCLASFPGDPLAFVSGRSDVIRVAELKNMSVQGSVTVKAQDLGPPPEDITVADDLVAARVEDAIAKNPDLARADPGELFHEVREKIKPHWGK